MKEDFTIAAPAALPKRRNKITASLSQKIAISNRLRRELIDTGIKDEEGRTVYSYTPGQSDAKIAEEFGLTRHHVYAVRIALFGPVLIVKERKEKPARETTAIDAAIMTLRKDRDVLERAIRVLTSELTEILRNLGSPDDAARVRDEIRECLSEVSLSSRE